jgi:DNA-binding MarR family transcriptional regulator
MDESESLLRAILATVARTAFPPAEIYKIVAPTAGSEKQVVVYNLCDGKTPQAEIGRRAKLDKGNLSRLISRWIESGIIIRIGPDQYPMHIYPLAKSRPKSRAAER